MHVPYDRSLAAWIRELIRDGEIWRFYKTREFMDLRQKVLNEFHHECADCLEKGRYTRAVLVHHEKEVRDRPDLALSEWYVDGDGNRRRNLVPLCFNCHELRHNRAYHGKNRHKRDRKREEIEERFPERW